MKTLLLAAPALLCALPAHAIVIRDDRPDSQYQSLAAQPQFNSVGRLINDTVDGCTGILVAPQWVITAGHCGLLIGPFSTFQIGGNSYPVAQTVVHPGWVANPNPGAGNDIAIFRLATPVTNVAPAVRLSGGEVGQACVSVGFGQSGVGSAGASIAAGTKRAAQNTIDALGSALGLPTTILLYDFDNPSNTAHSTLGSATPTDLEGGLAPGDSGGGVFIQVGGQWRVVGLHSFGYFPPGGVGNWGYATVAGSTRISSFNAWIDSTMCYANCDGSTGSSPLNVNDFVCFQSRFAAGDFAAADCNHDNALNVNDFVCFQASFAAGCP